MIQPRAADDFPAIRARMEELRRQRETVLSDEARLGVRPRRYPVGTDGAGMALVIRRMLRPESSPSST
jgi:hypothetical protein